MSGPLERSERERLGGHRALGVWLTGLSGAGKSTLAVAVERELHARGVRTFVIDGDELRRSLSPELGFSAADRAENVRRAAVVSRTLFEAGLVVITALISPFAADRARARALFPPASFLEVHVRCPLEVCQRRDPKGLYARAARGEIRDMTGLGSPYEAPLEPELALDTDLLGVDAASARLTAAIVERIGARTAPVPAS